MKRSDELVCIDDALRVYLVDVCIQHLLESCSESLVGELELLVIRQDLLHLSDCYTTQPLAIFLLQDVVELELL